MPCEAPVTSAVLPSSDDMALAYRSRRRQGPAGTGAAARRVDRDPSPSIAQM